MKKRLTKAEKEKLLQLLADMEAKKKPVLFHRKINVKPSLKEQIINFCFNPKGNGNHKGI